MLDVSEVAQPFSWVVGGHMGAGSQPYPPALANWLGKGKAGTAVSAPHPEPIRWMAQRIKFYMLNGSKLNVRKMDQGLSPVG